MEEWKCVSEIADLMRYVKDQLVFNQCIDELAKIYGKAKLWRDAVTQARGEAYYIPAMSKIYIHNPEIFQFERLMVHENRNGIKLYGYVKQLMEVFGEKGTGKTTLATSLQAFFLHGVDPPNLGFTSVPAMNDRVSQAVNTLVVLDEYKNDLDIRKVHGSTSHSLLEYGSRGLPVQ